ncbi:hypothetical protein Y032_0681g1479 [Ancylostoma ceylanicum]|uniref:Uncharacterized protein n=1 Tax=Ancylostoma ceylanicum TaxID=53326 RepID=A0A016WJ26_9BILA|nr:hypothetical protein Y032_0681g1479 [Ancylostoma ceylanicum]
MSNFSPKGRSKIVNMSEKMVKKGFAMIPRINHAFPAADFFPICVANRQSDTHKKIPRLALLPRFIKMKFSTKLTVYFLSLGPASVSTVKA